MFIKSKTGLSIGCVALAFMLIACNSPTEKQTTSKSFDTGYYVTASMLKDDQKLRQEFLYAFSDRGSGVDRATALGRLSGTIQLPAAVCTMGGIDDLSECERGVIAAKDDWLAKTLAALKTQSR